jgi:hypothetical protein
VNSKKVIRKRIRRDEPGLQVDADVNAVVAANVNEPGSRAKVSSRQRIVQKQASRAGRDRKGGDGDG